MTVLRFPAEIAVGEVSWEDAREPDGWGHLLAIGMVEVPDGTAVDLSIYPMAKDNSKNCAAVGTLGVHNGKWRR